jgi:hypothetical protein
MFIIFNININYFQALKELCWGSASMSPRNTWIRQGITLNPPDQLFAYGIVTPKVLFHTFSTTYLRTIILYDIMIGMQGISKLDIIYFVNLASLFSLKILMAFFSKRIRPKTS